MASPPSSRTDDEPITAEQPGQDPQRDFLRQALAHARWFAQCFGAQGEEARRWLDEGLACYPLALGRAMPARQPQLFWRALLGAELPGNGRMPLGDDAHLVEELLAQLDPAARAAFLLRVWHDFDDELLADLLGLRVGQVRVGLMRAFGLMRARLDDGGDGGGDAGQWLGQFRARLATLTARGDDGEADADRQRLARLYGEEADAVEAASDVENVAAPEHTDNATMTVLEQLRETSLRDAQAIDAATVEMAETAAASRPRGALPATSQTRRLLLPAWGLVAAAVALVAVVAWWVARSPEAPPTTKAPAPAAPLAEAAVGTSTPSASPPPSRDEEAVLASPDLPLLVSRLTPSQLAVMDQLRWWASTQPAADGGEQPAVSPEPAPEPSEPPDQVPASFEQLTAADRRLLQGFASLWPRLGEEQRLTLLDNARRWRGLGAAGRERVVQRSQSFSELPAQARARARDSFALWQSLPPGERDGLVSAFKAFAELSPEQQRAVADGFARLSPSEQAHWRFVAGERELLALAGRVFSFVPEAERADTLALLQALDEADRDRLRQATRRMSAWQREQLRRTLLAEPAESRAAWLRRRFGG